MDGATKNGRLIRFSVFELDRESGELFRQGRKIKLQGQPFELLVALLERPGEVLTREELRQKVWPTDTAGDFDHGLNRAVNKIREALGDSAETPRFIETLPRRGYRFIGSVQPNGVVDVPVAEPSVPETTLPASSEPRADESKERSKRWIPIAVAAGVLVIVASVWFAIHRHSERGPIQIQQLTTNSSESPVQQAALSPDGRYLAYGDRAGIEIRLISTGESHLLGRPQGLNDGDIWAPVAWFPDQAHLLASSMHLASNGPILTAWSVSVIGGTAIPIRQRALAQSISPDGSLIAFIVSHAPNWEYPSPVTPEPEIWVMGPHGDNARRIIAGEEATSFGPVHWSPDGKRLAYLEMGSLHGSSVDYAIESCDLDGGRRSTILSGLGQIFTAASFSAENLTDFAWLPDNRVLFPIRENAPNSRDTYLWEIEVDPGSGRGRTEPKRIARLPSLTVYGLSLGARGKELVFVNRTERSYISIAGLKPDGALTNTHRLALDEHFDFAWAWTPDSKAVILTSDRNGSFALYKQAPDQTVPELIPTSAERIEEVRASPDGASLIYTTLSNVKNPDQSDSIRVMRVPMTGGAPELLFESKLRYLNFSCPNRAGALCIASERDRAAGEIFVSFDPTTGAQHELFRTKDAFNWTVSPDGLSIAAPRNNHIEILGLSGQVERTINLGDWQGRAGMVDWAANGKALFVGPCCFDGRRSGATLLWIDLDGNIKPIWESGTAFSASGIASRDGRYLAINVVSAERNAWMIENF